MDARQRDMVHATAVLYSRGGSKDLQLHPMEVPHEEQALARTFQTSSRIKCELLPNGALARPRPQYVRHVGEVCTTRTSGVTSIDM